MYATARDRQCGPTVGDFSILNSRGPTAVPYMFIYKLGWGNDGLTGRFAGSDSGVGNDGEVLTPSRLAYRKGNEPL